MRRLRAAVGFSCMAVVAAACMQSLDAPAPASGDDASMNADGSVNAPAVDASLVDASITDAHADVYDAGPPNPANCPTRPDPTRPAPFVTVPDVNGSRLHAQYLVGADGSRFLWTLRDVGLGIDCWPGGPYFPASSKYALECKPPDDPTSAFYADATCKTQLWRANHGWPAPPRAGAPIDRASATLYVPDMHGVCGAYGPASAQLGVDFYMPGPDIPFGSFITLTPSATTFVPGEAIIQRGTDGSSFWLGAAATYGRDATASVIGLDQPSPLLLPPSLDFVPFATGTRILDDAGCVAPPYDIIPNDGGATAWMFAAAKNAPVIFRPMSGEPFFWIGAPVFGVNTCVRTSISDGKQFQVQTCNTSELVPMTSVRVGGTRLGRATPVIGAAKVPVAAPRGLAYRLPIDNATGNECRPYPASDGVLRCLDADNLSLYYADPACTQPIAQEGSIGRHIAHWKNGLAYVYPITATGITPAAIYYDDGSTCSSVPVPADSFSTLGPEIPPSSFVAVSLTE